MARAPKVQEPDDDDEDLGHHGPKDRDRIEALALTDEDLEPGWSIMASAPTNGKPVLLVGLAGGIPLTCAAYMHKSRRYTGSASRWVEFAEWRVLNTPDRVPFEPLAWSRFE